VQHKPVKTIKMTLKVLFGLKKNIGGANVYSETMIAIARKSQDLDDLIMNLDERSFGEYHTFKRFESSNEFLTLANVHQIKGRGFWENGDILYSFCQGKIPKIFYFIISIC
jgi:hypothetical protein